MTLTTFWTGAAAAIGTLLALLPVVQFVGRPMRKLLRQNEEFREDWYGRPARPGVAAEPGVMERLANIESNGSESAVRVARVEQRLDDHIRAHGSTPLAR